MNAEIRVGRRVAVGSRRGTVKFVGPVDGSSESCWIGVDWDNPTDGKNDGTIKNKRYFEARFPTSGSFVKPKDVITGRGLKETLYSRYCSTYEDAKKDVDDVEFVLKEGEEGLNVLQHTFTINLDNLFISHVEPDFNLTFPKCFSLSIAKNLLSDWTELLKILELFPKLQVLNISYNIFDPLTDSTIASQRHELQELVMNNCRLRVEEFLKIGHLFHQLSSLIVIENDLERVELNVELFGRLSSLQICRNPIVDFKKLWLLGRLPNLESLNLRACEISRVELPVDSFQQLKVLCLADNPINDWESVNVIGQLPRLKNFRSSGLHAGERGCQSYEMIVAKLPHAEVVDGCIINAEERRNCELMFLHRFFQPPRLVVHDSDVERLAAVYGAPGLNVETERMIERLCSFVLVYGNKSTKRKLPLHVDIKRLTIFASRFFGFSPPEVRVVIQILENHYETFESNSSTVLRALEPPSDCRVEFVDQSTSL